MMVLLKRFRRMELDELLIFGYYLIQERIILQNNLDITNIIVSHINALVEIKKFARDLEDEFSDLDGNFNFEIVYN